MLVKKDGEVITMRKDISGKSVFIFDVDDTLTESKADITDAMADLLRSLLAHRRVALLGGGTYGQLRVQCAERVLDGLDERYVSNFLFAPVSGGSVYVRAGGEWECVYQIASFTDEEKEKIIGEIHRALEEIKYEHPEKVWGEVIEDRGTQITFSALGQQAPVEEKRKWNETKDIRSSLQKALKPRLPDVQVRVGGSTSVDVTRTSKAVGAAKLRELLGVPMEDMVFFGDQLYGSGNDAIVLDSGIEAVPVSGVPETQEMLETLVGEM